MEKSKKKASFLCFVQHDCHLHSFRPSAGSSHEVRAQNRGKYYVMQDKLIHALASPLPARTSVDTEGASGPYRGIMARNGGKNLNIQDTQALVQAPPSLTSFGLDEVGPDAIKFGHPSSAHLFGSGSLGPNPVTTESCSDADVGSSFPSDSRCGHSPSPKPSPSAPHPSRVPFSSGVDFSCIPLPAIDVSAPSEDHGRASTSFLPGKLSVNDWSESPSLVHYPNFFLSNIRNL